MPYIPKQYDSAKAFLKNYNNLGNVPNPEDNSRLQAYALYDDFYYNRPETFKVTRRGTTDTEIYLPSTKKIVDATARFLAVDFSHTLKGGDQGALETYFANIFKREEISKRFVRGKKSLLSRGDQMWYITADDRKPKGERISIDTIHPSSVFRIEDDNDPFRVVGYHIVDIVRDPREPKGEKNSQKKIARRQTYRKDNGGISIEIIGFEIGAWDDRFLSPDELKPVWNYMPKRMLPKEIQQLPIYHIPNNEPDGSSWGMSQVAGIEYIIHALNQSITTEDLSLVLQGLGVYVTTAAPPKDKVTGKPGKYKLHPGNVVEISQGDSFERVAGINSVEPFQKHLELLDSWGNLGSGIPDMATGAIDVSVAQSGIALSLKMGPIIAENEDKQLAIAGKWEQLGYDLIHYWLPAFEGLRSPSTVFEASFGDPMPVNREVFIKETIDLWTIDAITTEEMRERLETVGYKHIDQIEEKLNKQAKQKADNAAGSMFQEENGASSPDIYGKE